MWKRELTILSHLDRIKTKIAIGCKGHTLEHISRIGIYLKTGEQVCSLSELVCP